MGNAYHSIFLCFTVTLKASWNAKDKVTHSNFKNVAVEMFALKTQVFMVRKLNFYTYMHYAYN